VKVALLVAIAGLVMYAAPEASAARSSRPSAHLWVSPSTLPYLGGRATVRWSAPHAAHCTLSAHPSFWKGRNPKRVRCSGRLTSVLPAGDFGGRWTFTLGARNAKGRVVPVARRKLAVRKPPFGISPNWSGYIVPSSAPITAVSGQFTIPKLNCRHTRNAGEGVWAGIGGASISTPDLLQTGVRSDCFDGVQRNDAAWWEEFPQAPEIDFKSMSVSVGDSIRASVVQNADTSWTTRVDDLTTGVSGVMTTGQSYGTVLDTSPTAWLHEEGSAAAISFAGGHTAEWIVEAFQSFGILVPLADFGRVAFTGLTTSLPSWGLTGDEQVGIGDSFGNLYAAPSGPDSSNYGFSITYTG
jgi:hypothetical protein